MSSEGDRLLCPFSIRPTCGTHNIKGTLIQNAGNKFQARTAEALKADCPIKILRRAFLS
jgi:hypothetical protein